MIRGLHFLYAAVQNKVGVAYYLGAGLCHAPHFCISTLGNQGEQLIGHRQLSECGVNIRILAQVELKRSRVWANRGAKQKP